MHGKFDENRVMHSEVNVKHTPDRQTGRQIPNSRVKTEGSLRTFKKPIGFNQKESNSKFSCGYIFVRQ